MFILGRRPAFKVKHRTQLRQCPQPLRHLLQRQLPLPPLLRLMHKLRSQPLPHQLHFHPFQYPSAWNTIVSPFTTVPDNVQLDAEVAVCFSKSAVVVISFAKHHHP